MVGVTSLWLPILLSAVAVFLASWVMHAMLTYHQGDFLQAPAEDRVADALRDVPRGDYMIPYGEGMKAMKDPDFIAKMTRGPVALITVMKAGPPTMSAELAQWFVYVLVVSLFAAYVAGRALAPGAEASEVVRFAGTTAFASYALALFQNSIWFKRKWSATIKSVFDGLVYALLTGAVFAWLWPM